MTAVSSGIDEYEVNAEWKAMVSEIERNNVKTPVYKLNQLLCSEKISTYRFEIHCFHHFPQEQKSSHHDSHPSLVNLNIKCIVIFMYVK